MNVGVGDTETHTQLFGEPCLGETSLLQMLFDEVAMLFLLSHRMIFILILSAKL